MRYDLRMCHFLYAARVFHPVCVGRKPKVKLAVKCQELGPALVLSARTQI